MNCIRKFLNHFSSPQIISRQCRFEENTDNGKICRSFMAFDASNNTIADIPAAKKLAAAMGKSLFPELNRLIKNEKDSARKALCRKTAAWVYKKAVEHPALVEKCTKKLLHLMKNSPELQALPLSYKEICTDLRIVAVLHDIGRLSEVDFANGAVCMKRSGVNKNHSVISFEILEHAAIKPEILLAIRYHEFAGVAEARQDVLYSGLSADRQKIAEFYTLALQDMDKTANLSERACYGIKKCAEFTDPHYLQDYGFTEQHLATAMNGQYLNIKGGHLLDAMARFVTWTYSVHFDATRALLSKVLSRFFQQMYKEAWREYKKSETKNEEKLAQTLTQITLLEDYAIGKRLNWEIDEKKRRNIQRQISRLKGNNL